MALRKGKFRDSSPKEQLEMLDPFVPILSNEILANSRHSKLLSKALKCLMMMLHLPLPSLKVHKYLLYFYNYLYKSIYM